MLLSPAPTKDPIPSPVWDSWLSRLRVEVNKKPYLLRAASVDATLEAENDCMLLVDCTTGNKAVALPEYSSIIKGQVFVIKKTDATANTVTISTSGSETIDGAATKVLTAQYQYIWIMADGTNWSVIG
jgi:hypothetical protein